MFNREWVAVIKRIVPNRDTVVSNLILIKERMREFLASEDTGSGAMGFLLFCALKKTLHREQSFRGIFKQ
jgi:hypothetical protein